MNTNHDNLILGNAHDFPLTEARELTEEMLCNANCPLPIKERIVKRLPDPVKLPNLQMKLPLSLLIFEELPEKSLTHRVNYDLWLDLYELFLGTTIDRETLRDVMDCAFSIGRSATVKNVMPIDELQKILASRSLDDKQKLLLQGLLFDLQEAALNGLLNKDGYVHYLKQENLEDYWPMGVDGNDFSVFFCFSISNSFSYLHADYWRIYRKAKWRNGIEHAFVLEYFVSRLMDQIVPLQITYLKKAIGQLAKLDPNKILRLSAKHNRGIMLAIAKLSETCQLHEVPVGGFSRLLEVFSSGATSKRFADFINEKDHFAQHKLKRVAKDFSQWLSDDDVLLHPFGDKDKVYSRMLKTGKEIEKRLN